jgi:phosphatidylinositol-3-phosphatase
MNMSRGTLAAALAALFGACAFSACSSSSGSGNNAGDGGGNPEDSGSSPIDAGGGGDSGSGVDSGGGTDASGPGADSGDAAGEAGPGDAATTVQQQVKHVFVITLENKNYDDTFGTSTQDPYLTGTLAPMGALLTQYYGTGHVSLDNYISMISGQASTLQTQADCQSYNDFTLTGMADNGQAVGTGCVYPATIKTLPDQLKATGYTWRGYMEDMGNDPTREPATCGHVALNAKDVTQTPEAPSASVTMGDQYAGRHDPFIYFHSIIDSADCAANVVNLSQLDTDLASLATTPNFVFVTPNLCNDGHDGDGTGAAGKGCVTGQPGGLTSSDAFLHLWVPKILASAAYKQDGLLIINWDESSYGSIVTSADAGATTLTYTFNGDSCCNEPLGPNVTRPSTSVFVESPTVTLDLVTTGGGGDRTGAVMISQFIQPGTVTNRPYNHYSMLRSIEDIFGLGHLGYAGQDGLVPFGGDIYSSPSP